MSNFRFSAVFFFYLTLASLQPLFMGTAAGSVILPRLVTDAFQIPFITNAGQVDSEVAFYTNTPEATVYVTRSGEIVYALKRLGEKSAVRESFVGARKGNVRGRGLTDTSVNFYRGSDSSLWRQDLKTFRSVALGRIYRLIDVKLVADKGRVEKLFLVHPGGDVSDIRGRLRNAHSLSIGRTGDLLVNLAGGGQVVFTPPAAYQTRDGKRLEVIVSYEVLGDEYRFVVGDHDKGLPLVIDPLLASTYLGGSSNETAYAMGISGGDIFIAGSTDSRDFPGLDEDIDILGDAFIVRLDPDLSTVRTATYFGGSMTDGVRDLIVDGSTIYAAGFNNSPDFPTTAGAAYSGTSISGSFVARFDARTLRLTASTSFQSNVFGLARSAVGGDIYIAGATGGTDFPLPGGSVPSFQATPRGRADSFVACFDKDLTTVKGATLLGGEGFDIIYDLAVDDRGAPVVAGVTNSVAFPVSPNAFGPAYNLNWGATHQWIDGFVARLTPDLGGLEAATYLGGGLSDNITAVATEGSTILVAGNTTSADFPCASTFGPIDGNDAYVFMFNQNLTEVKSCTVFGGSRPGTGSAESVSHIAVHPSGAVYAIGRTNASDFPTTPGAFLSRPYGSYFGAFIIAFNGDLTHVEASTLIHGSSADLKALVFDAWGDVIVAGDSSEGGYPVTPGALQSENAGGDDLVISRLTPDLTGPHIEAVPGALDFGHLPVGMEGREEILLHNTGGSELTIKDIQVTPGSPTAFTVENPCFTIPAFGSCLVAVAFKPALTGHHKGELVIFSSDHFSAQVVVDLKGMGIKAPVIDRGENLMVAVKGAPFPILEVRPDPCEFGEVIKGSKLTRVVRVTNSGNGDLRLGRVALKPGGGGTFMIGRDSCSGALLEAGPESPDPPSFCEVEIIFAPGMVGRAEARMILVSNDPSIPAYAVKLTGTGTETGEIRYPGFWGWLAILVLFLRMALGIPVSARGWGRWMKGK